MNKSIINNEGLDYRLKSEKTDKFTWYSVYENDEHVGHVSFSYTRNFDVNVESLFITNKNNGYGTKILREVCRHAQELGSDKVILKELMTGAYGLKLNDRVKIFKKIGKALKNEGKIKKVELEESNNATNIIYYLG